MPSSSIFFLSFLSAFLVTFITTYRYLIASFCFPIQNISSIRPGPSQVLCTIAPPMPPSVPETMWVLATDSFSQVYHPLPIKLFTFPRQLRKVLISPFLSRLKIIPWDSFYSVPGRTHTDSVPSRCYRHGVTATNRTRQDSRPPRAPVPVQGW